MPEGIRGQPLRLSRFHCREMLYDYMSGRLDRERHAAVEAGLKEFPDLKNELGALMSAAQYCSELGQIKPQPELVQNFQNIRLKSEIISEKVKYQNWPDLLRWSSEAIVISIFVAAVGWLIPWGSFEDIFKVERSNEVVLADLNSKDTSEVVVPPLENKTEEAKPSEVTGVPSQVANTTAAETAAAVKAAVTAPAAAPETAVQKPIPVQAKTPKTSGTEKKGPKGFLYRIMMNVSGIRESAPDLRDKIVAMGGEKAGQVEIGHRQATGNYFHFSIPESNYQKLLQTLGAYGPVRIYKGPHERVMPQGIIRVILDIQDAKGKAAPKAAETSAAPATGSTTETNEAQDSSAAPKEAAPPAEVPSTDEANSPDQ